jgi:hypothetical protein
MRIESESLAVASKVVHTAAVSLAMVQGYFNGSTANRWLQLFDAKALPANGTVPLRSWPLYMTAPFEQDFKTDHVSLLDGCVFAVSTTQATLTISADTMDLYVNGTSPWDNTGASVVGDYTTTIGVDGLLQIWADSAGPKTLLRLEVVDTAAGGDMYVQIHAGDTPSADTLVAAFVMPENSSKDFFFGTGLDIYRKKNDGTIYDGCTILISSSISAVTPYAGNTHAVKATYI